MNTNFRLRGDTILKSHARGLAALGVGLAFALLAPIPSRAQTSNTGTFIGTVKDQTGAAIPNTEVSLTNQATQRRQETTSNNSGGYQFLEVPIGTYRLDFVKHGFKSFVRTAIPLSAGQSLKVDAVLAVGSAQQTVTVTSSVSAVNTVSATLGSHVFQAQIQNIPLSTRTFPQLVSLQPGVASHEPQQPGFASNTSASFSFAGTSTDGTNVLLDGGRNEDTYNGNNYVSISLDAVQEMHIVRNDYGVQFGRNAGGTINVITKTGTNQFHGDLYEFFRNDVLNARNFFAAGRPETRYNDFGGTLGGPIIKNKLFFFFSGEFRRIAEATSTRVGRVPTAAQLDGDFSGLSAIHDPTTGNPFPNNQIPSAILDSNAEALLRNYYPPPSAGFNVGGENYTSSEPDRTMFNEGFGSLDYNATSKLDIRAHYAYDDTRLNSPYGLFSGNAIPGVTASTEPDDLQASGITASYTISPTLLSSTSFYYYHGSLAPSTLPAASRFRFPGFNVPRVFNTSTDTSWMIPSVFMSGYTGLQYIWPQNIHQASYQVEENVTWVKGKHTVVFGGGMDKENKIQDQSSANNNGTFNFTGGSSGDGLADLLLGDAFEYTESSTHVGGPLYWTDLSAYVQDTFQVRPRLTLTLGVRYESFPPETDPTRTLSYFIPSNFNFSTAAVVLPNGQIQPGTANPTNGIEVIGSGSPYGLSVFNASYDTFQPRVGLAYTLTSDNKTVLRAGFGTFYDRWQTFPAQTRGNPPFNDSVSIFNTKFSNPAGGIQRSFPGSLTSFASPWDIPTYEKYSVQIQRQLPASFLLSVGYVGSRGEHILVEPDINQPFPSMAVASGQISANAMRRYPGFATIGTWQTIGNSDYNSLQIALVRRLTSHLSVQVAYTYSKTMDDVATPMNANAPQTDEWALSSNDQPNAFVANYVYRLPFFSGDHGWLSQILGNWKIAGVTTFSSGFPLTVTIPGDRAGTGALGQRPNAIAPVARLGGFNEFFTTNAFSMPGLGTFGDAGRNLFIGPGVSNWDFSVTKDVKLRESTSLEITGQFFNIFNHAQFSSVGTTLGTPSFGHIVGARDPRIIQLGARLTF
ncbi:MAG TPA: TonB-dependent receptor [Bryobacteraceae bacterium]